MTDFGGCLEAKPAKLAKTVLGKPKRTPFRGLGYSGSSFPTVEANSFTV
jgi:hypothetical protein